MKILFLYPEVGYIKFYPGISSLIAFLDKSGHQISYWPIIGMPSKKDLAARMHMAKPDIVAFSCTSLVFDRVETLSEWVKETRDVPIICGGIHPTIEADNVINLSSVDMVCIGEGEQAFVELCSRIDEGKTVTNIANIWLKKGGTIYKNPIRPLIGNLDTLPFPDRSLTQYEQTHDFKVAKRGTFMASRGCPYQCSYCCNQTLSHLYKSAGRYVRYRSVENVIDEVEIVVGRFPNIEYTAFHDDILPLRMEWFEEFCKIYKKRINLPIEINCRPELINEDLITLLKMVNCFRVNLGIESGNDFIRNNIMHRNISKKSLIDGFNLLRNAEIKTKSYNMIGLPDETIRNCLDTVKINSEVMPSSCQLSIFYPFPGTGLFNRCREKGLISNRTVQSYFDDISVLDLNKMTSDAISFVFNHYDSLIKMYAFFYSRIRNRFLRFLIIALIDNLLILSTTPFGLKCLARPLGWIYKMTIGSKSNPTTTY